MIPIEQQRKIMEALVETAGCDCKPFDEEDFPDDSGLMCCHVCGQRKQARICFPLIGERIVRSACKCETEAFEREVAEREAEEERIRIRELFRDYSLVDERFKDSTFENCEITEENKRQVKIAKSYAKRFTEFEKDTCNGLLLCGSCGTGKTFLAACIANALMEQGVSVIASSIIRLTSSASPFGKDSDYKADFMDSMNDARLLILDDFGAERESDYMLEQVFEIINSRYNSRKPLIITTNLTLKDMQTERDLRKRRVYERLFETTYPVTFTGGSWRIKSAKDNGSRMRSLLED